MKETKESHKLNLEVTSYSVSFTSVKSLSSGNKFRDNHRVRNFILDSLQDGAQWTGEKETPHFRYKNIEYYVNGDKVGEGENREDAIAIPYKFIKDGVLDKEAIDSFIEKNNVESRTKGKSKTAKNLGGYLFVEMADWDQVKTILNLISDHYES